VKKSGRSLVREVALVGVMAALSNILALVALPGPLNIQFGLTAIPFLLVSFVLGPLWGGLCGLLGGVVQAQKYGHILYIVYTALQGFVAGLFARHAKATRRLAPLFALVGGFFLVWWVDLLRNSRFTLADLGGTGFSEAPKVFGMSKDYPFPIAAAIGAVVLLAITLWAVRSDFAQFSSKHLALAGCFGAVAYVPYDAWVLYWVQGYPWLPTWFVLGKDLLQDFIAAILCAILLQNARIRNVLMAGSSAEG